MNIHEKKYKVPEGAAVLGISEKTLWAHIGARDVAVYRIGRCVRIGEGELARILQEGFTPARRTA